MKMSKFIDTRQEIGRFTEQFAVEYCTRGLGWELCHRNWRCRFGELDIICLDGQQLAIVEVRSRTHNKLDSALESVVGRKAERLVRLSQMYCALTNRSADGENIRIDVIAITVNNDHQIDSFVHIRNAIYR